MGVAGRQSPTTQLAMGALFIAAGIAGFVKPSLLGGIADGPHSKAPIVILVLGLASAAIGALRFCLARKHISVDVLGSAPEGSTSKALDGLTGPPTDFDADQEPPRL